MEIGKLVPSLRQEEKEKNEKKAAPVSKKAAKKGKGRKQITGYII